MNFLKVRALTPGQRFKVKRDFSVLTNVKPEKSLLKKNSNRREKQCGENDDEVYWKWV